MSIEEIKDLLIHKYQYSEKELQSLSEEEISQIYVKLQKEEVKKEKNPNKFFLVKGMPVPKEVETKTSSKAGVAVFIGFIILILAVFVFFLLFAFLK